MLHCRKWFDKPPLWPLLGGDVRFNDTQRHGLKSDGEKFHGLHQPLMIYSNQLSKVPCLLATEASNLVCPSKSFQIFNPDLVEDCCHLQYVDNPKHAMLHQKKSPNALWHQWLIVVSWRKSKGTPPNAPHKIRPFHSHDHSLASEFLNDRITWLPSWLLFTVPSFSKSPWCGFWVVVTSTYRKNIRKAYHNPQGHNSF